MAIKVIVNGYDSLEHYNDPAFSDYKDKFYNHFNPDDWDYIIIGPKEGDVYDIACKLYICDMVIKEIDGEWIGVTYHA